MSVDQRECLILLVVFVAVVLFVFKWLVADLPDDFLQRVRPKLKQDKTEGEDGRLRDHW